MLRLKNIIKTYKVADTYVEALKGLDLSFRANEFVSILGPSGCGKTTLLNIIGGLDQYTSGDLVINGRSTKEFNDRDWDVYRNHRVGFIFQSYNLIPHQTILGNVELALTIAGISKEERIRRSKEAIDRVGLKGQYYKRPNQLSGGQCQRVAIARALVNEPEILLADEPTGALDTETSVQIMDLIKEISKEKLVIMVTHNPELADKYSNRIVRLLDGRVISDSNPFSEEEEIAEVLEISKNKTPEEKNKIEKAKMSFRTAFRLSFRNLLSKARRTVMTVIAGSIGIVGVACVLSVSSGIKGYIKDMQDDMLSGNPITITEMAFDLESMMDSASFGQKLEVLEKGDYVSVKTMIEYFVQNSQIMESLIKNNEINQDYIDFLKSMPKEYYNAITFDYGIDVSNNIYTNLVLSGESKSDKYDRSMSLSAITEMYTALLEETEYKDYASAITRLQSSMQQGVSNNDYISLQYDLVYGNLPQNKNDVLVVLDQDNALTDLLLCQLGYYSQEEFFDLIENATAETEEEKIPFKNKFDYSEICCEGINKTFYWYPNDIIFTENTNAMTKMLYPYFYSYLEDESWRTQDGALELNICGIVTPKESVLYGSLRTGFIYTQEFAEYVVAQNINSNIAKYAATKASGIQSGYYNNMKMGITYDLEYFYERADGTNDHVKEVFVGSQSPMSYFASMMGGMMGGMPGGSSGSTGSSGTAGSTTTVSDKIYSLTARQLGGVNLPSTISIYPLNFEEKFLVTEYLDLWNTEEDITVNVWDENGNVTGTRVVKALDGEETIRSSIEYTDAVEIIIKMINTMINIITYALVAFSCLALLVSTVMIGIITYVSVVERTKEIGVIRSLGGRKKDVSYLFNAETFMIGFASGVFGLSITALISGVLNLIIGHLAGVKIADLHLGIICSMLTVSIVLTLISGMIPAKSAANKNPVDAVRSE